MSKHLNTLLLLAIGATLAHRAAIAQSFAPIPELGSNVGPRLTMTVTQDRIQRRLFGRLGGTATYIDASSGSPTAYQFGADPHWAKVVFSKKDDWIREFNHQNGSGGRLHGPAEIDVSGSGHVFIADPYRSRVVVAVFDGESMTPFSVIAATLSYPAGVAWEGGSTPLITKNAYIVDRATNSVSYWTNSGSTWTRQWAYGTKGSGQGQFLYPTGVCAGRGATSANATSGFSSNFYVIDAGNRRVVRLERVGTGAAWRTSATIPEGWEPASCTVDHFGIVYVADKQNNRIVSFSRFLDEIARYGSYGTGNTPNTFNAPHDVHIPFGKKTVSGNTIWYGDGRILTAERWGPGSGGLEHWLGVEIPSATASSSAWGPLAQFRTTGMSYNTVKVYSGAHQAFDQSYHTVWNGYLNSPSWFFAQWYGQDAQGAWAPAGLYHFHVTALSAYGCPGSQPWCLTTKITGTASWDGPPQGSGECESCEPGECEPCLPDPCPCFNVALPLDDVVLDRAPRTFRLGQAISTYQGPLLRIEGTAGAPASGSLMTGSEAVASVRAHGIRALAVDIPTANARTPVVIRLFSLSGRLVRTLLDETVEPGAYVIGWDGQDATGRAVQPGVYLAVMTAGTYRGVQRLLLK